LPEDRAIEQLNRWGGRPLAISASAWNDGTLSLRLSGAAAAVKEACAKIGGSRVEDEKARAFWTGIREHTDRFFRNAVENAAPLWRISVPTTTPALGLQGDELIEWGGGLRWLFSYADARTVREAARRAGGHATLFRGGDKAVGVFHPLAPALMKIHKALKREFDPAGIFNRGRIYSDF
jgi:glycolate oxidase FAD binding subunit